MLLAVNRISRDKKEKFEHRQVRNIVRPSVTCVTVHQSGIRMITIDQSETVIIRVSCDHRKPSRVSGASCHHQSRYDQDIQKVKQEPQ